MITTRPRGTLDILPKDANRWRHIEDTFRQICKEYNFQEIRTPIFEHTELFERGVGDTTDIVEKEMYSFRDRGDRSITLRPEGTAPVVRAYLENNLNAGPQPVKLYYGGAMFRYDRPQAGRFRQFHQVGAEVIGSNEPAVDAELIAMVMDFYNRLGLKGLELHINSVGCPHCRLELRQKLQDFFHPVKDKLCGNCRGRLEKNPLRVLDCKIESCKTLAKDAPTTLDCLCPECDSHFNRMKSLLDGLGIQYIMNGRLVRGLDYYTQTAFEIMAPGIGAQSSIGGGGRYNGLTEAVGGSATPGVGYALGVERIILTMENQEAPFPTHVSPDVFVTVTDRSAEDKAFLILSQLRAMGLSADKDYLGRSLKSQMKFAGKLGSRFVIIIGGDELQRGAAVVRDMSRGSQVELSMDHLAVEIKKMMG